MQSWQVLLFASNLAFLLSCCLFLHPASFSSLVPSINSFPLPFTSSPSREALDEEEDEVSEEDEEDDEGEELGFFGRSWQCLFCLRTTSRLALEADEEEMDASDSEVLEQSD